MKSAFKDEIKSIFNHVWRAFIEANKTAFSGGWEPDFNGLHKTLEALWTSYDILWGTTKKCENKTLS